MNLQLIHRGGGALAMVPSTVLRVLPRQHWTEPHGTRTTDQIAGRLHAHSPAGSHKDDWAIEVKRLQAHRCGILPATSAPDRLAGAKRANWFLAVRGKSLGQAAPGSPKRWRSSGKRVVAKGGNWRYGSRVAVSPAADLGRSSSNRRTSAKQYTGAFLLPVFYGNCARDTLGCAGFLFARSANLRTAATILRLAANGGSSQIGATPMTHIHAPNPSAFQQHAAAWRARAIAALHSSSSLSVRLRRYNQAMARARALEVQEVANV